MATPHAGRDMSGGFVKIYGEILYSTVWQEKPETKVLWVTMLAAADASGFVAASVPGLAKLAGISLEQCEEGIRVLSSRDPYSRTKAHGGRRIKALKGGWLILNAKLYRERRTEAQIKEADRKRNWRHSQRTGTNGTRPECPMRSTPDVELTELTELTESTEKELTTPAPHGADISNLSNGKRTKAESDYAFMGDLRPIWQKVYGGELPPGSARRLKPLVDKHGVEEVALRFRIYCESTAAAFASIPKFAATFGAWVKPHGTSKGSTLERGALVDMIVGACNRAGLFSAINDKDFERRLAEIPELAADERAAVARINRAFCRNACQKNDRRALANHVASLLFLQPAPALPRKAAATSSLTTRSPA